MQWLSDIHLNFLTKELREEFYDTLLDEDILITGDIAESHTVKKYLNEMYEHTGQKIYFVAGNHDFYGSSIRNVKAKLRTCKTAHYLPKSEGVWLDDTTFLTGVDGWGDTRNGDFENSRLTMSDWLYIKELNKAYREGTLRRSLMALADRDAAKLGLSISNAVKTAERVIIATHVPPFEEACLYAGKKSTPSGLPFFSSQILGVTVLPIVEANPDVEFLWLSGHTHSRYSDKKRDNLTVKVAGAHYYGPRIEEMI